MLVTFFIQHATGSLLAKLFRTIEFTKHKTSPSNTDVPAIIQKHQSPSNGQIIGTKPVFSPVFKNDNLISLNCSQISN